MERLARLYEEALSQLRLGRVAGALTRVRAAAPEIEGIRAARSSTGQPQSGLRRRPRASEIQGAAMQDARGRLESLVAEVASLVRETEKARGQVREQRRLGALFTGRRSTGGELIDRSG